MLSLKILLLSSIPGWWIAGETPARGPYLATGVRTGEVSQNSAIIWVRLTKAPGPLEGKVMTKEGEKKPWPRLKLPQEWKIEDLLGACPGAPGEARVVYWPEGIDKNGKYTPWRKAEARSDFALQFRIGELQAGTRYGFRVETRAPGGEASETAFQGGFHTAWPAGVPKETTFTVITGMMFRDLDHPQGFHIYDAMGKLGPQFLVATGDTVYYDGEGPLATRADLARYHWHRMYSLPKLVEFHRQVPGYWMKDDHDVQQNDCWPGMKPGPVAPFTFEEGRRLFLEQVPMGETTYRSFRWGKLLEVWLVEGRDFRSPNTAPDGPEKTIWGEAQMEWLKESLLKSDAIFRVLISATPVVGPDRAKGKNDNHSNDAFRHEGDAFRRWIRENLPERFYIACGDRHWQYHSVHPVTRMQEFSCGPASDQHAGGSPGNNPQYHRFHRVGGGFLSVSVAQEERAAAITFRFHDVHGKVLYEYTEEALPPEDLQVLPLAKPTVPPEKSLYEGLLQEARKKLEERAQGLDQLNDRAGLLKRRDRIPEILRASFGGFPRRTPLKPRITGRLERDDHTVEKIIFESRPNFYVTANLYLPKKGRPPFPAILIPCGHSGNGKAGSTYQTAAQEFARRGFAALVYDPIGQGERYQFLNESGKPIIGGTTEHTVAGTCALLVGSNTAQVRIWDGIRAVDYLASRPDIDIKRLGCTGNSGGGTMTSYLMALETRIRAAAPSCYLTSMKRLLETIGPQDAEQNFLGFIAEGLDHADFLNAFAPRPALICTASRDYFDIGGTWTTFREAKRIYTRLGHPEAVDLVEVDGNHGYHPAIRQAVGRFFERALLGRVPEDIQQEVELGEVHPDPVLQCTETGQVLSALGGQNVADLFRKEEERLLAKRVRFFRETPRAVWLSRIRQLAGMAETIEPPQVEPRGAIEKPGLAVERLSWEQPFPVAALLFRPENLKDISALEIHAHPDGKAAVATNLARRARAGKIILALDLPGFGETFPGRAGSKANAWWGADWKQAFLAFHLSKTLVGIRADALRQAAAYARRRWPKAKLSVCGVGRAAVPAILAALLEPNVGKLRIERGLLSYASVVNSGLNHGRLAEVIPGALRYFDLPMLLDALSPREVEVVEPVDPFDQVVERREF